MKNSITLSDAQTLSAMKLNFEWKKIAERGQSAIGYLDTFELIGSQKAIAIIHYLPQYEIIQQRVMITLILEGAKSYWTKGRITRIMVDAEARIKNVAPEKFNNWNSLEHMDY